MGCILSPGGGGAWVGGGGRAVWVRGSGGSGEGHGVSLMTGSAGKEW